MGQGQEIIARKYMASATVEGQWVLLQNTHLGLGYLTEVSLHCACLQRPVPSFAHCLEVMIMSEAYSDCIMLLFSIITCGV